MKRKFKKSLAILLTVVMLISTVSVGFSVTASAATNATITKTDDAIIAVPETVYMTPSTGTTTSGQYYVNNAISSDHTKVVPAAEAADTTGLIEFYIPGAKSFKIQVNSLTDGIGDVYLNAGGATAENTTFNANADGSFSYDGLAMGTNTGIAEKTQPLPSDAVIIETVMISKIVFVSKIV